ncbi:MAG: hypothetical protein KIT25_19855 [Enhydrobacter sp.]|nr:MAG: hypothetical protein KIT25_19855 [Enhydrobacter sp.]
MSVESVHNRAVYSVLGKDGTSIASIQSALIAKKFPDHLSPRQISESLNRMEVRGEVRQHDGLWYAVPAEAWPEGA